MDFTGCLKIGATGIAGLFSGAALYVNAADHPSRTAALNVVNNRLVWKEAYNRAKKFQGCMCLIGSVAGGLAYYRDVDSEDRMLWLIGSSLFFTVWPFTVFVMMADIHKNLKDDAIKTQGEEWVHNHIVRWNKQHVVRTMIGMTSFGIFLYALSKK